MIAEKAEEQVLVVPSHALYREDLRNGFHHRGNFAWKRLLLILKNLKTMPRSEHETNEEYRALIPYILIRHDGWYYSYRRTGATDPRLLGNRSIGIGGHARDEDNQHELPAGVGWDARATHAIIAAAIREANEEIAFDPALVVGHLIYKGVINQTDDAVGRVHFGIVFEIEVDRPKLDIRDASNLGSGEWLSPTVIKAELEQYEGWSQLIANADVLR